MKYLVDGYNVLFHLKEIAHLQTNREELLEAFSHSLSCFKERVEIIFDGTHFLDEQSGLQYFPAFLVAFSSHQQTADEYIIEKIAYSKSPKNLTVITNDQGLARKAKELLAHVQSITWFLEKIRKKNKVKKEKPTVDSDWHMERLKKIFEQKGRE